MRLNAYDLDQFEAEPHCLHSSPSEEDQHEVLVAGSSEPTQHRDAGHMTSDQDAYVVASQGDTHVDYDLSVSIGPQLPKISCVTSDS